MEVAGAISDKGKRDQQTTIAAVKPAQKHREIRVHQAGQRTTALRSTAAAADPCHNAYRLCGLDVAATLMVSYQPCHARRPTMMSLCGMTKRKHRELPPEFFGVTFQRRMRQVDRRLGKSPSDSPP